MGSLLAVGLVAILVVGGLGLLVARRRRDAVRVWAEQEGWSWRASDRSLVSRWSGRPFGAGAVRRATEVVSGPASVGSGRTAVSFRYTFQTPDPGDGGGPRVHEHHVVAVMLPATLPPLDLAPANLGTRIATALGGQDVVFESDDFNRRWRVTSPDLRLAHDVVHPRTMARLLEPDVADLRLRFAGDALLTWTSGRPRLDTVRWTAARLDEMIDLVPSYVWQDRASGGDVVPKG
jgi:hypothetical protein